MNSVKNRVDAVKKPFFMNGFSSEETEEIIKILFSNFPEVFDMVEVEE